MKKGWLRELLGLNSQSGNGDLMGENARLCAEIDRLHGYKEQAENHADTIADLAAECRRLLQIVERVLPMTDGGLAITLDTYETGVVSLLHRDGQRVVWKVGFNVGVIGGRPPLPGEAATGRLVFIPDEAEPTP